jgi:hypothetical protein
MSKTNQFTPIKTTKTHDALESKALHCNTGNMQHNAVKYGNATFSQQDTVKRLYTVYVLHQYS